MGGSPIGIGGPIGLGGFGGSGGRGQLGISGSKNSLRPDPGILGVLGKMGGGGGGTTTVNQAAPPTDAELALQEKQLELTGLQVDAAREQNAFQTKVWDSISPTFDAQKKLLAASAASLPDPDSPEGKQRIANEQKINDLIQQDTLQRLEAGGGATPKELEALRGAADAAIESGGRNIDRFSDDALKQLRDVLAPSRGLRPTDSPITDSGGRVLSEAIRAKGDLVSNIRASEAAARLNAPLATQQFYGAVGTSQAALAESSARFATDLRESAAMGRLQLAGGYGGFINDSGRLGLGLIQGTATGGGGRGGGGGGGGTSTTSGGGFQASSLIGPGIAAAGAIAAAFI